MKPMMRIAMPALAVLVLAACGGGGGGAGLVPAMPEAPSAAEPVAVAAPEPEPMAEPVGGAEHNRLVLPGFVAPDVDDAMFRLAHEPYNAPSANQAGGGLAAASLALQAGALVLYEAQRAAGYSVDSVWFTGAWSELETQFTINPNSTLPRRVPIKFWSGGGPNCNPLFDEVRVGECVIREPGHQGHDARSVSIPLDKLPFVGSAMREGSKGYRTRNGVNLRYWSSSYNPESAWPGWGEEENATDFWAGYGASLEWSGFGLVMHAHDHLLEPLDSASYFSLVGGDATGRSMPAFSGTWRGAAIATPGDMSFIADGSVELTITADAETPYGIQSMFNMSIGDWQGYLLNDGEIGSITDVPIGDIEIDGYLPRDVTDTEIGVPIMQVQGQGGGFFVFGQFFGPAGEEFAGSFRSPVLGSCVGASARCINGVFGAKLQSDN